ncbi:MAG: hypothetical protein KF817_00925 [Phycisphaeraceae bacterium]|nr:hypothetical protein [Phycisphaeraceae bacterium]
MRRRSGVAARVRAWSSAFAVAVTVSAAVPGQVGAAPPARDRGVVVTCPSPPGAHDRVILGAILRLSDLHTRFFDEFFWPRWQEEDRALRAARLDRLRADGDVIYPVLTETFSLGTELEHLRVRFREDSVAFGRDLLGIGDRWLVSFGEYLPSIDESLVRLARAWWSRRCHAPYESLSATQMPAISFDLVETLIEIASPAELADILPGDPDIAAWSAQAARDVRAGADASIHSVRMDSVARVFLTDNHDAILAEYDRGLRTSTAPALALARRRMTDLCTLVATLAEPGRLPGGLGDRLRARFQAHAWPELCPSDIEARRFREVVQQVIDAGNEEAMDGPGVREALLARLEALSAVDASMRARARTWMERCVELRGFAQSEWEPYQQDVHALERERIRQCRDAVAWLREALAVHGAPEGRRAISRWSLAIERRAAFLERLEGTHWPSCYATPDVPMEQSVTAEVLVARQEAEERRRAIEAAEDAAVDLEPQESSGCVIRPGCVRDHAGEGMRVVRRRAVERHGAWSRAGTGTCPGLSCADRLPRTGGRQRVDERKGRPMHRLPALPVLFAAPSQCAAGTIICTNNRDFWLSQTTGVEVITFTEHPVGTWLDDHSHDSHRLILPDRRSSLRTTRASTTTTAS